MNNEASTETNYQGLVVVVPTRNRAQLAMNAVRSVLEQPVENVAVMISDNSTLTANARNSMHFATDFQIHACVMSGHPSLLRCPRIGSGPSSRLRLFIR